MQCPLCQHSQTRVCDSRNLLAIGTIRRKRECLSCGGGFFTLERAESVLDSRALWVLKKDGREERFAVEKLCASLRQSLASDDDMAMSLCNMICAKLHGGATSGKGSVKGRMRVTSYAIGLLARSILRERDEAAYVRYASAGAGFRTLEDFTDFLTTERATERASGQARWSGSNASE